MPAGATTGPNPLASKGYTLAPLYPWGIDYYATNFQSSISDHAAIIKQLYFRQALAYLMNQAAIISGRCAGTGRPPSVRSPPPRRPRGCRPRAARATRSPTTQARPRAC